jgi:hypothetical protein
VTPAVVRSRDSARGNAMSDAWIGVVGTVVGAILGFFLNELARKYERDRRNAGYWPLLRAEIEECARQAKTYLDAGIAAPLYRLPRDTFERAYQDLVGGQSISPREAAALATFYRSVAEFNRGLDEATAARRAGDAEGIEKERNRNNLKASRITSEGEHYRAVNDVLRAHGV